MVRQKICVVFWCICLGILLSCTQSTDKQTLVMRLGAEPSMLNPILSTDAPSSSVNGYIFNGLLKVNEKMELVPDLAEKYTVSEDGRRLVFYLKKNVKWHDGVPFTASDVVFTFDKILDSNTNTVRRSDYIINGEPIGFEAVGDYEIRITLPSPFAPLLNRLTMGIIPKHIFNSEDINISEFNRKPIGTGPFVFQRWETSQFVLLTQNLDFFDKKPTIETVLLKIIPDNNTALVSFEKEEIYSSGIPGKEFPRISESSLFQTFQYYDLAYTYLGFNLKNPLFSMPDIRQAIAMAINKKSIVDGILRGYGTPAHLPTSPEMWTYPKRSFSYDFDPEGAKSLLKEAGFVMNSRTGIFEKNGDPFQFKIITNKGNKDREKAAEIIQGNLKDIGIDVSLQLMEWSSFIAIVNSDQDPKDYDAVILGWSLGLDPDGYSIWHSSQYPKGFNFIGYQNETVDRFLELGRVTMDRDKRQGIYQTIYDEIAKDVPYVFLYYPESLVGINHRVKGLSEAGPTGLFNPIENIYIEE
ncbi:peptide-binding protein [Candidatus Marinamargulisbacteria bacterium SCGC AG-343-D04]|nr:peptide-binding protein [Candidatus Marinamargulisbacteria bacterium SCGC AG-343-D04]